MSRTTNDDDSATRTDSYVPSSEERWLMHITGFVHNSVCKIQEFFQTFSKLLFSFSILKVMSPIILLEKKEFWLRLNLDEIQQTDKDFTEQ